MMYSRAAQLADGSGWHYVTGGHPIGYCTEHAPHATEAEARECYARWQRDHVAKGGRCSWTGCYVRGCSNPAREGWHIEADAYSLAILCDEHDDREHAIEALGLNGPAGDRWES